ncbi:MAG: triple tyrosine motif-containing protein, partial [Bacillota bacterium]|nr:triple tyrosine motif-containing protein [Bacillota bacterium]
NVKDSKSTKSYDTFKTINFQITAPVVAPSISSFTADKASPQVNNTAVNLTASASGGTSLLYQFWAFDGTNWTLIKDYSSSYTATWTPTTAGSYTLYVNVKDSKSTKSFDTFKTINFQIN